jgi:hypothetical protein
MTFNQDLMLMEYSSSVELAPTAVAGWVDHFDFEVDADPAARRYRVVVEADLG